MFEFRERFEVKNEVTDIHNIKEENVGKLSEEDIAEVKAAGEKIGFDEFDKVKEKNIDDKKNDIYREKIDLVKAEIDQHFDDTVTEQDIKSYITEQIENIYGEALKDTNILTKYLVEGYFENNKFIGSQSFENIAKMVEESIEISKELNTKQEKLNRENIKEGKSDSMNLKAMVVDEKELLQSDTKDLIEQDKIETGANLYKVNGKVIRPDLNENDEVR